MTQRSLVSMPIGLLLSLAGVQGTMANTVVDPPCPTTGTYLDLLNTNVAGGCTINVGGSSSLTFSHFTFAATGPSTPNAAGVSYTLDDPGVGPGGGPIFGFEFNPGLSVSGTNVTQDIMLSYLIVPHGVAIVSADLNETAAATGEGVGQVTENIEFCIASDPNNTSGTCRMFPHLHVTTGPPPALEDNRTFGQWTSMTVSKDINASSGASAGAATITQVRDAVDVTPEPATYGLVGIGLLTIGYFCRRRSGPVTITG